MQCEMFTQVLLVPGEMVWYESGRLVHGRYLHILFISHFVHGRLLPNIFTFSKVGKFVHFVHWEHLAHLAFGTFGKFGIFRTFTFCTFRTFGTSCIHVLYMSVWCGCVLLAKGFLLKIFDFYSFIIWMNFVRSEQFLSSS